MSTINAEIPKSFEFLFSPARYKIAYGGRGSGKSWAFARSLILLSLNQKERVLCTREVQKSIKESVHKLLCDQAEMLGVRKLFSVTNHSIKCTTTGSEFIFEGIYQNVDRIKSLEGVTKCWVEEAHRVSEESWEILLPTIRRQNSEVWITFNPDYEDDDTFKRWVKDPPENAVSQMVNYDGNPWFPEVLETERKQDEARLDKDSYENKWLGKPKGMGRKVWAGFDRTLHVKHFDNEKIAEGNCFMAMDPHSHYYPFCIWMSIIPKNSRGRWPEDFHKHVYAEWPTYDDLHGHYHEMRKKLLYQGTLKEMAIELYAKDGIEYGAKVEKRFIDTRFAKGSGSWSWSTKTEGIVTEFAKAENGGLLFELPYERLIDAQKEVIRQDMSYNKLAPINQFNEPSFSVDPSCRNTITSLLNHRLEEGSEKESDKYKEPSDCIRILYAGLNDYTKDKEPDLDMRIPRPGSSAWMG